MSLTIAQLHTFLRQNQQPLSHSYANAQLQLLHQQHPSDITSWPLTRHLLEFYGRILNSTSNNLLESSQHSVQQQQQQYDVAFPDRLTLRPNLETSSQNAPPLLALTGTIPVQINNQLYNIPCSIVLPRHFPSEPPHVRVQPTAQMICRHDLQWLDSQSGYIRAQFIPFLNAWQINNGQPNWQYQRFDLGALVAELQKLWARETPVYANVNRDQSMTQSQQPHGGFNPHHPQQSWSGHQSYHAGQSMDHLNRSQFGQFAQQTQSHVHSMAQSMPMYQQHNLQHQQQMALQATRTQVIHKLRQKLIALQSEQQQKAQQHALTRNQLLNVVKTQDLQEASIEDDEMKTLEATDSLGQELPQFREWVEKEFSQAFDVEQVVVPNSALSQQLMETQAKDLALTDLMFNLDSALRRGLISSTSEYLSTLRRLGREQFQYRALCEKILELQGPS